MRSGDTLLIPAPGAGGTPHLWIIATEPDDDHLCIIVNFTTLRNSQDQTVSIMPSEHPFVTRPTSIRYSDARIADVRKLRADASTGLALPRERCSATLLKLIQDGLRASPYTPNKVIEFYEAYRKRISGS